MANFNKVMLMGNLTRDPEVKYLPSNTALCRFGLAVNRRFRRQDGEQGEETLFVDCVAFGKQAEVINQYMQKGRPLFIEGRLKLDQWEDQSGQKRSKHEVVVEGFQFVDSRGGGGGGGEGGGGNSGGGASQPRRSQPQPAYNAPPPPEPDMGEDDIPF